MDGEVYKKNKQWFTQYTLYILWSLKLGLVGLKLFSLKFDVNFVIYII